MYKVKEKGKEKQTLSRMQQENFLPVATLAKIRTSTVQDLISCMNAALGHSSTLSPSEASPFTPLPQPKILLFINCLEN